MFVRLDKLFKGPYATFYTSVMTSDFRSKPHTNCTYKATVKILFATNSLIILPNRKSSRTT